MTRVAQKRRGDDFEEQLHRIIGGFYYDPIDYVMFNWPWSKKGTFLEHSPGPRNWQRQYLLDLGREIKLRDFDGHTPVYPIQFATSSGHSIGKSALSSWIVKFIHDTRPYSDGVVTANTSEQLSTKTWAQLGLFHNNSLTKHWSSFFNTRGNMRLQRNGIDDPDTWKVVATTCREENSEAFAGLHAVTSTPFYLFDEASNIPDKIWEVSDGGLFDGEPWRLVFGNPTRSTGRFRECFRKFKKRWNTRQIDSREVEAGINLELINEMIEDFGEDSDYIRVRVRGLFPNAATTQFISSDIIYGAQVRNVDSDIQRALVMGVDVARFGDDKSVIVARHGRDARTFEKREFRGASTTELTNHVILYRNELIARGFNVDGIFVDGAGVGGGVVDQLRQKGVPSIYDVQGAARAQNHRLYENKRTECYVRFRKWLKIGAIRKDDIDLYDDLVALEYGFSRHEKLLLESKDIIKKRLGRSPDDADALALTFAEPIVTVSRYPVEVSSPRVQNMARQGPRFNPKTYLRQRGK